VYFLNKHCHSHHRTCAREKAYVGNSSPACISNPKESHLDAAFSHKQLEEKWCNTSLIFFLARQTFKINTYIHTYIHTYRSIDRYKIIVKTGSCIIINSPQSSATCGVLPLGNQKLSKRKCPTCSLSYK
jgi:hypothetical protein